MRLSRYFLLFLFCLVAPFLLHAQVQATLSLADTNAVFLKNDTIALQLTVQHAPNFTATESDPTSVWRNTKGVKILQNGSFESISNGSRKTILISVADTGNVTLLPLTAAIESGSGNRDFVRTDSLRLHISPDELADLKPIVAEPFDFVEDALPYLLIGAGVLVLLGFAWVLYQRWRKPRQSLLERERAMPPHIVALAKLDALQAQKKWQQGDTKGFQTDLTYILREYIEHRYYIPALESTTEQLRDQLHAEQQFDEPTQAELFSLLRNADMLKFANVEPNIETHAQGWDWVRNFVTKTQFVPTPTETV